MDNKLKDMKKMLKNITSGQSAGVLRAKFEQQTGASTYVTDGEVKLPGCIPSNVVTTAVERLKLADVKATTTSAAPTMDTADEHLEVVACSPTTMTQVFRNIDLFCDESLAYFDHLHALVNKRVSTLHYYGRIYTKGTRCSKRHFERFDLEVAQSKSLYRQIQTVMQRHAHDTNLLLLIDALLHDRAQRLQARIDYLNKRPNENASDKIIEQEGIEQIRAWLRPFIATKTNMYHRYFQYQKSNDTHIVKPHDVYLAHVPLRSSTQTQRQDAKKRRAKRPKNKRHILTMKNQGLFVDLAYQALNQVDGTHASEDTKAFLDEHTKVCDGILRHTMKHMHTKQSFRFIKQSGTLETIAHAVLINLHTVLDIQKQCHDRMAQCDQNSRSKLLLALTPQKTQDEKPTAGLSEQPIVSAASIDPKASTPQGKTTQPQSTAGIMPHPASLKVKKPKTIRQKLQGHKALFLAIFSDHVSHYSIQYRDLVRLVRAAGGRVETCGKTGGCRRRIVLCGTWSIIKQGGIHAPHSTGRGNQLVCADVVALFRCAFERAGITPRTLGWQTTQADVPTKSQKLW